MTDLRRTTETTRHDFAAGETGRGPSVPSGGLANDPKAGQWDGRRMSKRMIADYKTFIVTDGEGVRNSLYVSGCPFHCVDCFNASIWDFQAGHEYTQALEDRIIEDLRPDYVQGITFLGGAPLLATPVLIPLLPTAPSAWPACTIVPMASGVCPCSWLYRVVRAAPSSPMPWYSSR